MMNIYKIESEKLLHIKIILEEIFHNRLDLDIDKTYLDILIDSIEYPEESEYLVRRHFPKNIMTRLAVADIDSYSTMYLDENNANINIKDTTIAIKIKYACNGVKIHAYDDKITMYIIILDDTGYVESKLVELLDKMNIHVDSKKVSKEDAIRLYGASTSL